MNTYIHTNKNADMYKHRYKYRHKCSYFVNINAEGRNPIKLRLEAYKAYKAIE